MLSATVSARGGAIKLSEFIITHMMQSKSCLIRDWLVILNKYVNCKLGKVEHSSDFDR